MSVRHLNGALQWGAAASLHERLQQICERNGLLQMELPLFSCPDSVNTELARLLSKEECSPRSLPVRRETDAAGALVERSDNNLSGSVSGVTESTCVSSAVLGEPLEKNSVPSRTPLHNSADIRQEAPLLAQKMEITELRSALLTVLHNMKTEHHQMDNQSSLSIDKVESVLGDVDALHDVMMKGLADVPLALPSFRTETATPFPPHASNHSKTSEEAAKECTPHPDRDDIVDDPFVSQPNTGSGEPQATTGVKEVGISLSPRTNETPMSRSNAVLSDGVNRDVSPPPAFDPECCHTSPDASDPHASSTLKSDSLIASFMTATERFLSQPMEPKRRASRPIGSYTPTRPVVNRRPLSATPNGSLKNGEGAAPMAVGTCDNIFSRGSTVCFGRSFSTSSAKRGKESELASTLWRRGSHVVGASPSRLTTSASSIADGDSGGMTVKVRVCGVAQPSRTDPSANPTDTLYGMPGAVGAERGRSGGGSRAHSMFCAKATRRPVLLMRRGAMAKRRASENVSRVASAVSDSFVRGRQESVPGPVPSADQAPTAHASPSEVLRKVGNDYFNKENYTAAIEAYTEALVLDPFNTVIRCNRAAAYLLFGQFMAAVADCDCVLFTAPDYLKAHWRAAKGLLCHNRHDEARRHYRAAMLLCSGSAHPVQPNGNPWITGEQGNPVSAPTDRGVNTGTKWLREKKAILAEGKTVQTVEDYWVAMQHQRWTEAMQHANALSGVLGSNGPVGAPWRAKYFEAMIYTNTTEALKKIKCMRDEVPDYAELYYLHAKALFYCAHDPLSTEKCLELLAEGKRLLERENAVIVAGLRAFCSALEATGDRDAVKGFRMDERLASYRLKEDSRVVQLRRAVTLFSRYRDDGNAAYARADWRGAISTYTRCLDIDAHNHSLLSATYCNRAAVCMQEGHWKEALQDVHESLRHNVSNAKAYSRRGRIYLHLFEQQQTGVWKGEQLDRHDKALRYIQAAVDDFRRAVELSPIDAMQEQLRNAEAMLLLYSENGRRGGSYGTGASYGNSSSTSDANRDGNRRRRAAPRCETYDDDNDNPFVASPGGVGGGGGPRGYRYRSSWIPDGNGNSANAAMQKHLRLLGLHLSDTFTKPDEKVVSRAYREAALRWHPDKWADATGEQRQQAENHFKAINVAYHALKEM